MAGFPEASNILESWRENPKHSGRSRATTLWLQTSTVIHQGSYSLITLLHPQWLIAFLHCLDSSRINVTPSQKLTRRLWFLSIQTYVLSLVRITFPWSFIALVITVLITEKYCLLLPLSPFNFSNLHHVIFIRRLWLILSI